MLTNFLNKWLFNKKILIIFSIILVVVIILLFIFFYFGESKPPAQPHHPSPSHHSKTTHKTKFVPLTAEERKLVEDTISTSEFVSAIPEKYPISLQFFYFENHSRVWQDKFLIAGGRIVSKGSPAIKLTLHSKYLKKLPGDLCGIIKTANENRDLGFDSQYSKASLLWKYKSMLKYRECFGF